jgi:flagellar hook-associated protein FlgK
MITNVGELMSDFSCLIVEKLQKKSNGCTVDELAKSYFGQYYGEKVRSALVTGGSGFAYIAVTEETLNWLRNEGLAQQNMESKWVITDNAKMQAQNDIDNKLEELLEFDTSAFDHKYTSLIAAFEEEYSERSAKNNSHGVVRTKTTYEIVLESLGGIILVAAAAYFIYLFFK